MIQLSKAVGSRGTKQKAAALLADHRLERAVYKYHSLLLLVPWRPVGATTIVAHFRVEEAVSNK